eukprot:357397-Chlamydomonas_euryale.AAC.6
MSMRAWACRAVGMHCQVKLGLSMDNYVLKFTHYVKGQACCVLGQCFVSPPVGCMSELALIASSDSARLSQLHCHAWARVQSKAMCNLLARPSNVQDPSKPEQ